LAAFRWAGSCPTAGLSALACPAPITTRVAWSPGFWRESAKPGAGGGAADPIVGSGQEEKVEHEDFFSAIKSGLS
jgi:hypothetical protein